MQGYQRPTLKLVWPEDSEFHGLEVKARRMALGTMLDIAGMQAATNAAERLTVLIKHAASVVISWNFLDEDGEPVPATEAGFRSTDQLLLNAILGAAAQAVAGVSPPLPQPSTDGGQSLEASIPMETLSENQESSPEPG